jgi:outer membrane protein W
MNMNKKVLMTVVLAGATTLAMAQKPTEGNPSSLEVQMNLAGEGSTVVSPALKYRYFLSENLAIRFGLGYNSTKDTENVTENGDGTGGTGTREVKTSNFNVAPGIEYHFAGTDRLSPYLGLAISFGSGKTTETWDNYADFGDGGGYAEGVTAEVNNPVGVFGFALLAGMDFYVAENLFLGGEFGWASTTTTQKEGDFTVTVDGDSSTGTTPEQKSSSSGFGAVAGLRLGWRF